MSRCRMITLYDESERFGGLVAGTSNRTETLLGYFTMHGDGAAALKPIAHLYKCQVRDLARHMNVPAAIIDKAPSADLWAGQTDEGELGFSYDEADQILYLLTEAGLDVPSAAAQGFDIQVVEAVARKLGATAYKRRQPPEPSGQAG
jgi:NAD+ synthase